MNCKHIKKFICFKVHFKPFTTSSSVKLEHIFNSFQQNPNEQMKTMKFVPLVRVPKISADIYHDPAQQAMISKRILCLQNGPTSGTVGAKAATNRLQNLMQIGPSSLMNFSTKRIVKSRSVKSISKHKIGSIGSSSRSSFINKSNSFLSKFILSNAESTQKRYRSTGNWASMSATRLHKEENRIKTKQERRAGSSYSRSLEERIDPMNSLESDRDDISYHSNEISDDAAGKLAEVSARIRDDLMKIDGSMKERLISMRRRMKSEMVQNSAHKEVPTNIVPDYGQVERLNLNLMPMVDKKKDALAAYLEEVNDENRTTILKTRIKPSGTVQIRRNMITVDQPGDGRGYTHQLIEPMTVRGNLMDTPAKAHRDEMSSVPIHQDNATSDRHVLGIRIKDSADADGVYYVRKRRM